MKNIITTILFLSAIVVKSQVAIGKSTITAGSAVSLEFYDSSDNVRGIVMPWVSTVADNPVTYNITTGAGYRGLQGAIADGTIIFDLSDKKIKYRKAGVWFDLTGSPTFPLVVKDAANQDITIIQFGNIDSSLQDSKKEAENAKTALGKDGATDTTNGIIVLTDTDTDKAMVLPKVASPHLNVKDPAPGMIVFDTTKRQLAVYNGTVWSFWKP